VSGEGRGRFCRAGKEEGRERRVMYHNWQLDVFMPREVDHEAL
jgi:hypothetical protein